jgi:hypothetical protein
MLFLYTLKHATNAARTHGTSVVQKARLRSVGAVEGHLFYLKYTRRNALHDAIKLSNLQINNNIVAFRAIAMQ